MDKFIIAASYSAAATTYDQAAFVEQEIGLRLMQRLEYIKIKPKYILDLGCGTGYFTRQLQSLYPGATIIGLDLAFGMVKFASNNNKLQYCCADAEQLPFFDLQFDLIFSNCCMPSIDNINILLSEVNRILAINGLLLFTTFGPNTLQEFTVANNWQDMHNIGDILLQKQYKDPVVDSENLLFTYKQLHILLNDLNNTGSFNIDTSSVTDLNLPCNATFEVIYGQALKQKIMKKQHKDQNGNVYIPLSNLQYI